MESRDFHLRGLLARRLPGRFTTKKQEITNGSADELRGQQPRLDRRSLGRLRHLETFHLLLKPSWRHGVRELGEAVASRAVRQGTYGTSPQFRAGHVRRTRRVNNVDSNCHARMRAQRREPLEPDSNESDEKWPSGCVGPQP